MLFISDIHEVEYVLPVFGHRLDLKVDKRDLVTQAIEKQREYFEDHGVLISVEAFIGDAISKLIDESEGNKGLP